MSGIENRLAEVNKSENVRRQELTC